MFRVIGFQFNRFRAHLASIEAHIEYPDLMAPPLPCGIDCRGQLEMDHHWEYRRKILQQRNILDASRDVESAGYKPENLELFHD